MTLPISFVREVLCYVQRFRGEVVVVKLGSRIMDDSESLGIIRDICSLKKIGINVAVAHNSDNFSIDMWEGFQYPFLDIGCSVRFNFSCSVAIPIFRCEPSGDSSSEMSTAKLAISLGARKLIFVTNRKGVFTSKGDLVSEISVCEAESLIKSESIKGGMREKIIASVFACQYGVKRAHIISGQEKGSLLLEVFSCDGIGSMVFDSIPYKVIREALVSDISVICDIVSAQFYIHEKKIKEHIDFWYVFEIDGEVIACVQVDTSKNNTAIKFLSCDESHDQSVVLRELISHLCQKNVAHTLTLDFNVNSIVPLIHPWFKDFGFKRVKEGLYIKDVE